MWQEMSDNVEQLQRADECTFLNIVKKQFGYRNVISYYGYQHMDGTYMDV